MELHSALGIQVRRQDISKTLAAELLRLFNRHCTEGFYQQTSIESAHFTEAERLLTPLTRKLRSADALHLAVAKLERFTLVTLDDDLADAAREEALTVVRVWDNTIQQPYMLLPPSQKGSQVI